MRINRHEGRLTVKAVAVLLLAACTACGADFSPWAKEMSIRFAGYTQAGTLTNFPALVQFAEGSNAFHYADAAGDGSDLRFTAADEITELNYEIESWNPSGVSYVWVQVPALADSNTSIRAFYGNAAAGSTTATNPGAVWPTNAYAGVWHLSAFSDSTSNRNTAANSNTTSAAGQVAQARTLTSTPTWIEAADTNNTLDITNAVTFSAWIKPTAVTGYQMLLTKQPSGSATDQYPGNFEWRINVKKMELLFQTNANATPAFVSYAATTDLAAGIWQHVAVALRKSPASGTFYINGVSAGTFTPDGTFGVYTNNQPVRMGRRKDANNYFVGSMDEVEIATVMRASNWVWSMWMSQASNRVFNLYGDATLQALDQPVVTIPAGGATNRLPTAACLNGGLVATGEAPAYVWAYWDTVNRGTNKTWAFSYDFGATPQSTGALAYVANNLTSNTWYWYTYYVSNSAGDDAWADSISPFKTPGAPGVDNGGGATAVYAYLATIRGSLTNGVSAHAYLYWGTNASDWSHTNDLGIVSDPSSFSANLAQLTTNTTYYYCAYATNDYGEAWAPVTNFTTQTVPAGVITWDGGGGNILWTNAANWNPDGTPRSMYEKVILLDNNAPSTIDMTSGGTAYYPYWVTLEITKSDANLDLLVRQPAYATGATLFNIHPPVPRTYTLASYLAGSLYAGGQTAIVDGVGTVFSTDAITPGSCAGSWSKKGSGLLSIAKFANSWGASVSNINIEGVLHLRYDYGYAGLGTINGQVNLASNSVLWAQGVLTSPGFATGSVLDRTGFGGYGTVMLNGALDASGTIYSVPSAGAVWSPGTEGGPGRLTVNGNVTFSTNGFGSNCTLRIDVTGNGNPPVVGTDFDQLYLAAGAITATSLTNVNLVVNVTPSVNTAGKAYRIIDDTGTDFSGAGKAFNQVAWSGTRGLTGTVNYVNGYIELNNIHVVPKGTTLFFW
jgi:hypothetical protein